MATKKKEIKKEIKGEVFFKNIDAHLARLELEYHKLLVSNRRIDIPADVFPYDFELEKYEVKGSYSIRITITEK